MNRSPEPLRETFERILELAPAARDDALARIADPSLRERVRAMLLADADACAPLVTQSPDELAAIFASAPAGPLAQGARIGDWVIDGWLGEGGSSSVYRAWRNIEGTRQAGALKLLRRGLGAFEARLQFDRERRALARLDHPDIARLIDGGVTPDGMAYLVLELVDGRPITEHARSIRAPLAQRITLIIAVARAVDAAHRALVVHRDLKPSNVLVTEGGRVKLLDFGIAKLLDGGDDGTRTAVRAFTPAYAAPEQRDGGPITTATDVYALGVLAGELLTGSRLSGGEASTPSLQVATDAPEGTLAAPPSELRRLLRGDLDNILAKALELDPSQRYRSAAEFADDLQRALDGRPVSAHPPSWGYRLRKFVRRHRAASVVGMALGSAFIAALAIALWQGGEARLQAQLAEQQLVKANAARDLLIEIITTAEVDVVADRKPTIESIIAAARRKLDGDAALALDLQRDLSLLLGEVALSLGSYADAEALMRRATELSRRAGLDDLDALRAIVKTADILVRSGRTAEAVALLEPLEPRLRAMPSQVSAEAWMTLTVAHANLDDVAAARRAVDEAIGAARATFPAGSRERLTFEAQAGALASYTGDNARAIEILQPTIDGWIAADLPLDEQIARLMQSLAVSYQRLGRDADAERLFRQSLDLRRRLYPEPNPALASILLRFGTFLVLRERLADGMPLIEEARDMHAATQGTESAPYADALWSLGVGLAMRHAVTEAGTALRRSFEVFLQHEDDARSDLVIAADSLLGVLVRLGSLDEADSIAAKVAPSVAKMDPASSEVANFRVAQAGLALARGDAEAALATLDAVLAAPGSMLPRALAAARWLRARCLLALGRADDAAAQIDAATASLASNEPSAAALQARMRLWRLGALPVDETSSARERNAVSALLFDPALLSSDEQAAWRRLRGTPEPG